MATLADRNSPMVIAETRRAAIERATQRLDPEEALVAFRGPILVPEHTGDPVREWAGGHTLKVNPQLLELILAWRRWYRARHPELVKPMPPRYPHRFDLRAAWHTWVTLEEAVEAAELSA